MSKITASSLGVFFLGACFYFYDFLLQVSPSVMAVNLLQSFNITATLLGIAMGTYFYSYTLMQIPAGLLLDQFGAKRILPIAISLCAAGALFFGVSHGVYFLAIGRLLMGAGSAFAFLGALYLALRWLPVQYFAIFAGFTQMLGSLGAAVGEAPFAYCVNDVGWRTTMLILSFFGFVFATIVFLAIKNRETKVPILFFSAVKKMRQHFREIMKHSQTWPLGIYSFAVWVSIASFAGLWGVAFLQTDYQLSNIDASRAITTIWFAIAITCPLIGWLSEKFERRKIFLIFVALIGLISMSSLIYWNKQPFWLVYIELAGIGIAGSGQSLIFAVIKDNQPVEYTGAANGFNNMMIVLGGAIFQPLIGKLLDWHHPGIKGSHLYTTHDYHFALTVLPGLYIAALVLSCFFIKETYCRAVSQKVINL